MRNLLMAWVVALYCLVQTNTSQAQNINWMSYDYPQMGTKFMLPVYPVITDSMKVRFYNSSVDSLLSLQIHGIDSAYLDQDEPMLLAALQQNNGDTLKAIAQLILFATNSKLVSLENIIVKGRPGIEMGIDYLELQSDVPTLCFMRYFRLNDKFLVFSITGSKDDIPRLMNYKNIFFNSINFF